MAGFDVVFVLPYPASDHPSFPEGLLKRVLEAEGFRVGVIQRPRWQETTDFAACGRPRLFFAVIGGPVDSMVLNYTSLRKRRREDQYQVGSAFFPGSAPSVSFRIRPDRTVILFANRLRQLFKDVPIVVGGIEASMRRFAHFDFQEQKIRRSILLDARADLLVWGGGETQIVAIARALAAGDAASLPAIPGTAAVVREPPAGGDVALPSGEEVITDPPRLLEAQMALERAPAGRPVFQAHGNRWVRQNPAQPYGRGDLDRIYGLGYTRRHLDVPGCSPALRMSLFSVTAHRGCGGGCSFCAIAGHEGRGVVSRSPASVIAEIEAMRSHPEWRGQVGDVGGPTAEMYGAGCGDPGCVRSSCLQPAVCPGFRAGRPYLDLLRACRAVPGVEKVFVASGCRHDLLLENPDLLEEILRHHAGRFLRIAPEHTAERVLRLMGKPPPQALEEFVRLFSDVGRGLKRPVGLAAYLIAGFPGETEADVREMKGRLGGLGLTHVDVQVFTPTPGTLATAMYVAGRDPQGNPLAVERSVRVLADRQRFLAG